MNSREEFTRLLVTCAMEFRKDCLAATHNDTVTVQPGPRAFHGPAMLQPWDMAEIKGGDLIETLYGLELKPKEIFFVWDRAVSLLAQGNPYDLHDWLRAAQPYVPFTRPFRIGAPATMVQFLMAASWYTGDLEINPNEVILWVDRVPLGFTRTIVKGNRTHHRLRRAVPLLSGITTPLGNKKWSLPETAALYEHLKRVLPEQHRMIDLAFSAAVYAGRDFEEVLTHKFNIDPYAAKSVAPVSRLLKLQQLVR